MTNQKPHINDYKDGMNKDFNVESLPASAYEDAQNVRLFTSGQGSSVGAVQNVKGNQLIVDLPTDPDGNQLYIIGICQLRDSIVVFATPSTLQQGGHGYIYEVDFNFQALDSTITLIYDDANLKFSRLYPIEAIGIQENPNYERVYFSDHENPTRSINIRDLTINDSPVTALNFFPNPGIERPVINNIGVGGSLKPGIYSYAYYFKTLGGNTTILSPISSQIHIVEDSDNNTANTKVYKGVPEDIEDDQFTSKLVNIEVDLSNIQDDLFSEITLVAIYQSDYGEVPQILEVETVSIANQDSISLIHTGAELETTVRIFDEFLTENVPFLTNKTFAIKDNILFCANIKREDIKIPDEVKEGLFTRRYLANGTPYTDDGFSIYNNPFNDESGTIFGTDGSGTYNIWREEYQYKYQSNGTTLGGEGNFINYQFTLERLESETSVNDANGSELSYFYSTNQTLQNIDIDDGVSYLNRSFRSFASPYNRVLRGYKRGEVYRFGIVFFNSAGVNSSVQFIGDIKFPEISDTTDTAVGQTSENTDLFHFPVALSRGYDGVQTAHYSDVFSLGIKFNVNLPQDFIDEFDISHYQIVRCKRREIDKSRLAQGVINKWYRPVNAGAGTNAENLSGFIDAGGDNKKFYPIAEMQDICGHLNRYLKHDNNESGVNGFVGERYDAFQLGGSTAVAEGVGGLAVASSGGGSLGYTYNGDPKTGIGYPSGINGLRRYIEETSVPYQSAAAVENLVSFHCPEATFNHFLPELSEGSDYLRTVGILTYTTKWSDEVLQYPFGQGNVPNDYNHVANSRLTILPQWGHTYYARGEDGTINSGTDNFTGFRKYRPMLGAQGVGNPPSQHANYPEYDDLEHSRRRFVTKARQTSPVNVLDTSLLDLHLSEDNFEKISDLRYLGPDTYRDEASVPVGGAQCRNLAWQLGNVHADAAEKTRMARGGTALVAKLGDSTFLNMPAFGGSSTDGQFIAKNSDFQSTAGQYFQNYAGSAFLVDYVRRTSVQYGGNGPSALAANTFYATSAPIKVTDNTFKVFEGDTFITFYEFFKNFWNNQWDGVTAFNGDNSSGYEIVILPVESTINCYLNAGGTIKSGGTFTHDDGTPQSYRLQEHTDGTGVTNVAFNGTTKAFDYKPLFSEDQITKTYFADPINFNPVETFDVRTYYSNTKILGEKVDAFTTFGILDYKDIDPAYGPINRLLNLKDEVVTVQDDAIGVFLINTREMMSSESGSLVTIGSGQGVQDFNYLTTQNGSIHQYASIVSNGIAYILDAKRKSLIILNGTTPADLSKAKGMNDFLNKEIKGLTTLTRTQGGDNPLIGIGATLGYDQVNREVLISILDNRIGYNLNSTYGQQEAFQIVSGNGAVQPSPEVEVLIQNGQMYSPEGELDFISYTSLLEEVPTLVPLPADYVSDVVKVINDGSKLTNATGFTLVYSEPLAVFTSFYTFLPSIYINHNRNLFTVPQYGIDDEQSDNIYIHNIGPYGNFYDNGAEDTSITITVNSVPLLNKILRFVEYNCTVKNDIGIVQQSQGLTRIRVQNDYQDSGVVPINQIHRFRKFRVKTPRDENDGRFRATYFNISLFFDNSVNLSLTLQRIMSFFDIQTY